jgi:hypothetical protein
MAGEPFNPKAPHGIHTSTGKIPVLDQNGLLYDGITEQELTPPVPEQYVQVEGMPFSKVTTEAERLDTALATIRATGAVDPDSMSKFEGMLREIQKKQTVTVTKSTTFTHTPKTSEK